MAAPTASAEKFDIPAYAVVLWCALSWAAGTAWMLRWDMALLGGVLAAAAGNLALLLLAPILGLIVIPALTVVAIVVQASLIVAAALLTAAVAGFMSGLRSAAAAR